MLPFLLLLQPSPKGGEGTREGPRGRLLGSGMSEATSETLLIGDGTAAPAVGLALLRYLYADAVPQVPPPPSPLPPLVRC